MSTRSIVDIEVNTAAFDKFQQQYQKYQDALAKGPKLWREAAKEQKASVASFQKMSENMQTLALMQRRLGDTYKSQNQQLMQGERLWGSMATHARGIASSITGATRSMLAWTGIISAAGGLLGVGSVFGIDRMARTLSGERSSAMGLGMSIGQKKAFDITFGARGISSDSFLSWISQMEVDPSKVGPAAGMGVGLTGNTGADAISMLRSVRAQALANPSIMGMLPKMFGLEGLSPENIRQLAGMPSKEFEGLGGEYGRLSNKLNISDKDAESWQNFLKKLDETTGSLFKTIEHGLLPLEPSLEKLSGAFEKFLTTLLKSDLVKDAITGLAKWMNDFAGEISTPAFLESVKHFTSDVGDLAETIHALTHPGETISNAWNTDKEYFAPTAAGLLADPRALQRHLGYLDTKARVPAGFLETIKQLESSGNPNAVNISAKGAAMGLYGFMPETWRQYGGGGTPFNPVDASYAAERYAEHLRSHFGSDTAKSIAAWNAGEAGVDAAVAKAQKSGGDWRAYLPRESRQYVLNASPLMQANGVNINLTINNNTGGSINAVATQLPY